jgi:hypothetical protein
MLNQLYALDATNQGIKKSEFPERKEGNKANTGVARARPVAMATQELYYASIAQLVESSPMLSVIERESKRPRLKTAVPTTSRLGPPHPKPDPSSHLHYHRNIFSPITMDLISRS